MHRAAIAAAAVGCAVGCAAVATAAEPAAAGTPITFTIASGGLSISQPASTATLTTGTLSLTGATVTGQLGTTTVTDLRGGVAGSWTVTIAGPASFTDGVGDTVATSAATVWVTSFVASPLATSAVRTDLHLLQATGVQLSATAQTLVSATTVGTNSATFNPNISITVPTTAVAATYTGVVTQTVS